MANNVFKIKRTSVSGRAANTSTLTNPGELALNITDGIMYSTNGSFVFEVGANNTNVNISNTVTLKAISANGSVGTSGQVLKSNGSSTFWGTDSADVGAAGQILYRNASNVLTTSSGLQYDGTSIKVNGNLESLLSNGDEGGEIYLEKPATGTTLAAGITIDLYQNKLRFFERGGNNRGAYIDITAATNGVGSNLLGGSSNGTVTSVGSGNGLTGGPIITTGTLSVLANTGIVANTTGLFVNTTYIGTLSANNASFLGGTAAASYQLNSTLSANVATLTANNTSFVGSVSAANVVSNAQLSANLANYQTTAGLTSNVATLSANNASFLGGTAAASYQLNSTLNANIASYLPTYTGVVNGSSFTVGSNFIANSTVVYTTGSVLSYTTTEWPIESRFASVTPTNRPSVLMQRANNTIASPTAVTSGMYLGGISMGGYDGSNWSSGWNGGAEVMAVASEAWSNTAKGTGLFFNVTAAGSNSLSLGAAYLAPNGNFGIGTTSPSYKLQVNGSFAATTKSFVIKHPTKPNMKLRYGSLEGPENGVYVRGRSEINIIELPDYWTGLIDEDSITVQLTPIGKHQNLYVDKIEDNKVYVKSSSRTKLNYFYMVNAERKDVEKLQVEVKDDE